MCNTALQAVGYTNMAASQTAATRTKALKAYNKCKQSDDVSHHGPLFAKEADVNPATVTEPMLQMLIYYMRPLTMVDGARFQQLLNQFNLEYILPSPT